VGVFHRVGEVQPRTIGLIVAFCAATGLVTIANMLFCMILGEVNGRLPEEDRVGPWFVSTRVFEVLRLHAALYPKSQLRIQMNSVWALGLAIWTGAGIVALFG
jgi:hypothetical protein